MKGGVCDFPGHRDAWPFSMALAHSTCSGNIGGINHFLKKVLVGTSLVVQWLRVCLPTQGMKVPSLVGEPRSHMPHNQKTKNMKNRSSIVADSVKTLQMAHIIKKMFKERHCWLSILYTVVWSCLFCSCLFGLPW